MQQEFITVTFNRTKIALRCADILYVIMSDDHCTIHMFDESVYRCRMTLKELKKQLDEGFIEVKRGCMIAKISKKKLPLTPEEYSKYYKICDSLPFAFTDIEMVFNEEKRQWTGSFDMGMKPWLHWKSCRWTR